MVKELLVAGISRVTTNWQSTTRLYRG